MKKWTLRIIIFIFVSLLCHLTWVKMRSLWIESDLPLVIRMEGFYLDKNFRDVGDSINQCYGEPVMKKGKIMRSNGWFSGWECSEVGDPEVIYSLNFDPKKNEKYFCWNSEQSDAKVGKVFNPNIKLHDLEFMKTWSDNEMRQSTCRIFDDMFQSIGQNKKVLYHCNAGRDRTGAFSAVLAALAAEAANMLDEKMVNAIECDYRKTKSLRKSKYGRMANFLNEIRQKGTIKDFLKSSCGIDEVALRDAEKNLSAAIN